MAGTAVLGRLTWRVATVADLHDESATARTLRLTVPGWPGHLAGQHVDIRLTASDGYSAVRSYSIANAQDGERVEVTVERLADGEVSPYLVGGVSAGDKLEIRGPIGGWFVWRPEQQEPVQLVAGGSGIVPLMAMLRTRAPAASPPPFRLLYSLRSPDAELYGAELARRERDDGGLTVTRAYTRTAPANWPLPPRRVDAALFSEATLQPSALPTCYVCGPTAFVEVAADLLRAAGHDASRIRTERFGPSGGTT